MYRKILVGLIAASSLILVATAARADGETWCKIGDPNDTYVNKRYPANGRITVSFANGMTIWVTQAGLSWMEKGGVGLLFFEMIDPAEPTMCWQGSPTTATLAVEEAAAQYGSTIRNFVWR